jgi:hypothetical protein
MISDRASGRSVSDRRFTSFLACVFSHGSFGFQRLVPYFFYLTASNARLLADVFSFRVLVERKCTQFLFMKYSDL